MSGEQEEKQVSHCRPGCSRCEAQGKGGQSPGGFGGLPVRGPQRGTRRLLSEAPSSAGARTGWHEAGSGLEMAEGGSR